MKPFSLRVLAADRPVFEGECVSLVIPVEDGQYGILAHHSDFVSAIRVAVSDGMVRVSANSVIVLVDSAEREDEIDEELALHDMETAKEDLSHDRSRIEYAAAQARLARAMNRLKVVRHK